MKRAIAMLVCLILPPLITAQSQSGPSKVTQAAVWQLPSDFNPRFHKACDGAAQADFLPCIIRLMHPMGASQQSVAFTQALYKASGGEFGILTGLHPVGPVDIAWVTYPLRANTNYGLLFVNGQPAIVNVEDLKLLDQNSMQQDPQFQNLKAQYPNVSLWPGDRSGMVWPNSQPGPNGGVQFTVGYPLLNGCHACARVGTALFQWNFDAGGKFGGTQFLGMTDNQ